IVTLPDGPADELGIVEAIAIGRGRILAAGTAAEVEGIAGPGTRRIELALGEVALPGLSDAHLHMADAAVAAGQLDLADAATPDEALALVRAEHERLATGSGTGEWLRGAGWDAAR